MTTAAQTWDGKGNNPFANAPDMEPHPLPFWSPQTNAPDVVGFFQNSMILRSRSAFCEVDRCRRARSADAVSFCCSGKSSRSSAATYTQRRNARGCACKQSVWCVVSGRRECVYAPLIGSMQPPWKAHTYSSKTEATRSRFRHRHSHAQDRAAPHFPYLGFQRLDVGVAAVDEG